MAKNMTRVVAAMSGGVDSSVAALLLKEKGFEVVGITIKTWPKEECGETGEKLCCSLESIQYARSVAEDIGVPHYVVDLSKDFAKEVKGYFIGEYAKGRTPNPCVYCNSRIKFGSLWRKALSVGAERIASGHYARVVKRDGEFFLAEALDKEIDQSYFLCDIPKKMLGSIDFPIGGFTKDEVRRMACERAFMSADRKGSQDLCFTAGDDYRGYLVKSGANVFSPGDVLDSDGKTVGRHNGIAAYTVGQRHGLGIAFGEPTYVLKIDPAGNTVTVGPRALSMKSSMRVAGLNWLIDDAPERPLEYDVKIRYASKKARALVTPKGGEVIVEFAEPQFAPAPGQAAVFYDGDIVACSGWIE